jgi:membrane protein involved in colicin uptake
MVNTRIDQMEAEMKKLKEAPKGASQVDLNDTFGNKSIGVDLSPLKGGGDKQSSKDATPTAFPPISLGNLLKK